MTLDKIVSAGISTTKYLVLLPVLYFSSKYAINNIDVALQVESLDLVVGMKAAAFASVALHSGRYLLDRLDAGLEHVLEWRGEQ